MSVSKLLVAIVLMLACSCSNPCDQFVERQCECGRDACAAARNEVRLEKGLLIRLGGGYEMKAVLYRRCQARLKKAACRR